MTQNEMITYNLNALDQLNNKIETYLDNQYNKGRIKGTDYAATYAQLLSTAIQTTATMATQAVQADNQQKQTDEQIRASKEHSNNETKTTDAQVNLIKAQKVVAEKQANSFDISSGLQVYKTSMDALSMVYSSNPDANEVPYIISDLDNLDNLYTKILHKANFNINLSKNKG